MVRPAGLEAARAFGATDLTQLFGAMSLPYCKTYAATIARLPDEGDVHSFQPPLTRSSSATISSRSSVVFISISLGLM